MSIGPWRRFCAERMARIIELNAAAPWGDGTEGLAFRQSYMQGGGPDVLLSRGLPGDGHIDLPAVSAMVEAGKKEVEWCVGPLASPHGMNSPFIQMKPSS